jgi:hypothetical protein
LFAEDSLRKLAYIDPDSDRIGSAGFLSELATAGPTRDSGSLTYALLESRLTPRTLTPRGPALAEGEYLLYICLPMRGGGYTANPGDPVDNERAEREWFAWAWPAGGRTPQLVPLAIDQDERILKAKPSGPPAAMWRGASAAPTCDPAVLGDPSLFEPWRGKRPRTELPYAR